MEWAALRGVVENGPGSDERDTRTVGDVCGFFNPYTVIATIAVMSGQIERRVQGLFEAQEFFFEPCIVLVLIAEIVSSS